MFLGICICIGIGCDSKKEATKPPSSVNRIQRIDSLFQAKRKQNLFHGGIVISKNGEVLYENYSGLADRTWDIPVKADVKFDIASVNKSMIAGLTLKAVEEGKISLDDRLIDLLSDYRYEGKFDANITLHHLLSHSSGLPDYDRVSDGLKQDQFLKFKRQHFTNEGYVNFISQIEPINEPGQQFYYSNFAYHLVCIILEHTYDMPFGKILQEKLTNPLGLKHTISESNNEIIIPNLAKAYNYQQRSDQWHENNFIDLSLGRRIFSTASDLNRWAQVMDNPGWLSEASLSLMKQNHLVEVDKSSAMVMAG